MRSSHEEEAAGVHHGRVVSPAWSVRGRSPSLQGEEKLTPATWLHLGDVPLGDTTSHGGASTTGASYARRLDGQHTETESGRWVPGAGEGHCGVVSGDRWWGQLSNTERAQCHPTARSKGCDGECCVHFTRAMRHAAFPSAAVTVPASDSAPPVGSGPGASKGPAGGGGRPCSPTPGCGGPWTA